MKYKNYLSIALFIVVVDCIQGCVGQKIISKPEQPTREEADKVVANKVHVQHQEVAVTIPISIEENTGIVNADFYVPLKSVEPKTLVLIVPGAGNVSRNGEVSTDGINTFASSVEVSKLWAKALADRGFFVLTYDKRTCTRRSNKLCRSNEQGDIDKDGIVALSRDLDQVFQFAVQKLGVSQEKDRVILLTSTQGAQVLSRANCSKTANALILLSPIINDLDTMWINGLERASTEVQNISEKNRLLNRKESMHAFFISLERGDFPNSAHIHGASVQFWLSWLELSRSTLSWLLRNDKPSLLLFSKNDNFSPDKLISEAQQKLAQSPRIEVKQVAGNNRNFAGINGVDSSAFTEAIAFISKIGIQKSDASE